MASRQAKAITVGGDSILYQQVIDSLIQVALVNKQLHPIIIISKSKRLKKPKGLNDEDVSADIHLYAEDSINYLHNAENYKVMENKQLRRMLLSIGQLDRNSAPLPLLKTSAQIQYKVDGWAIFKNYAKANRFRKNNPKFFCVADITKPVYNGDYAIVVVDHQFAPLGGGGYMHIFKKTERKWQTYALVNLWNY